MGISFSPLKLFIDFLLLTSNLRLDDHGASVLPMSHHGGHRLTVILLTSNTGDPFSNLAGVSEKWQSK